MLMAINRLMQTNQVVNSSIQDLNISQKLLTKIEQIKKNVSRLKFLYEEAVQIAKSDGLDAQTIDKLLKHHLKEYIPERTLREYSHTILNIPVKSSTSSKSGKLPESTSRMLQNKVIIKDAESEPVGDQYNQSIETLREGSPTEPLNPKEMRITWNKKRVTKWMNELRIDVMRRLPDQGRIEFIMNESNNSLKYNLG